MRDYPVEDGDDACNGAHRNGQEQRRWKSAPPERNNLAKWG